MVHVIKTVIEREDHLQAQKSYFQAVNIEQNKASRFKSFLNSSKEMIKFCLSSLVCAVIDLGLFTMLYSVFSDHVVSWSLLAATGIARLVSSVTNFLINKKLVFKSRDSVYTQATKYFSLCAIQMIFSWLVLQGLTFLSDGNVVFLKSITDIFLFLMNFLIQRIFIFRRQVYHE